MPNDPKRRLNRWFIDLIFVVVGLVAVLYVNPMTRWMFGGYDLIETIRLGSEANDARIEYVADRSMSSVRDVHLRVRAADRSFLLRSLSQLCRLIHIRRAEEALRLVRLTTDYEYAFAWPHEEEIAPYRGSDAPFAYGPECLPREVFRGEGFTEAKVRPVADEYVVDRWVLRFGPPGIAWIDRGEEHVSANGCYTRRVLKEIRPRPYPNVIWATSARE